MWAINSTNVRLFALRSGFAVLQELLPGTAASVASRMFLRTPERPSRHAPSWRHGERLGVEFRGEPLAAWSFGEGPTVLLVHGWGGRASQMRSFVEPLRRRGYRVVLFDAPGHGSSPGSELSLPSFAEALERVAVASGSVHAVLAHSFGAAASALALAGGLSAERAVFIGPPSDALRWFERFSDALSLSPPIRSRAKAEVERRVGAPFTRFSAEQLGPAIQVPLLVVHDRLDAEVPWDDGARIARSAPRSTLLTTEGLGHRRIMRHPSVVQRVVDFIASGRPAPERLGCASCGGSLAETWDPGSELCMTCELHVDLADPSRRWQRLSA